MDSPLVSSMEIHQFSLWEKMGEARVPWAFDLEATARCNNDCRHCYINLPAADRTARGKELSLSEISRIADEAASLGAVWCLVTGGEPLLREDFCDLYLALKRRGLIVSVFTNAILVRDEHLRLFERYPPRKIEVSVYGVTPETYERVTRMPGSFAAFTRGLERLLESGIRITLKAMALRSNVEELPAIARFCRERSAEPFRFDPLLHLRFDRDVRRNAAIRAERLPPHEIVAIERADDERFGSMQKACSELILPEGAHAGCDHVFHCGAGNASFSVSYDGLFRLCSDLCHPDSVYDLRKGSLADAWRNFVPKVRALRSSRREFLDKCRVCPIANLCLWCPARSYLETGQMDAWVESFCEVAHARVKAATGAADDGSVRGR